MYTGVIKWYNPVRGFGFIALDGAKEMVYADNQKLVGNYRPALLVGTKVRFDLEHGRVGCQAINIIVLDTESD
ncbi:cold-shock protein [Pedobacter sp. WC2501]|uniref:cold-shock protein n=1 Tax=Pedobacter sp. WC2501 TaxID=3461400 RepID=UPI0040461972